MKILKIVLIVLGALIALYLICCFLGPKRVDVTAEHTMAASAEAAYGQVIELTNWSNWSPWHAMDPDMKLNFNDQTAGVGATYSWESATMGNGNLEIIESEPIKSIRTKIQFSDWEGYSYGKWSFEDAGDGKTRVSWGMEGDGDIPFMARGFLFISRFEKTLHSSFKDGLQNLDTYLQQAG